MRNATIIGIVSLFVVIGGSVDVQAQPAADCGCGIALKKDYISNVRTSEDESHYLRIIDQQLFSELKANASLTASMPIVEGIISRSATFDVFSQNRQQYFDLTNYRTSHHEAEASLKIVTNPIAYRYWAECHLTCSRSRPGSVVAWKEREGPDGVLVNVIWNPGPANPTELKLVSSVQGGTVTDVPRGRLFPRNAKIRPNSAVSATVTRTGQSKIVIDVGAEQYPMVSLQSEVANRAARVGLVKLDVQVNEWRSAGRAVVQKQVINPFCIPPTDATMCNWGKSPAVSWVGARGSGYYWNGQEVHAMVLMVANDGRNRLREPVKLECIESCFPEKDHEGWRSQPEPWLIFADFRGYGSAPKWQLSAEHEVFQPSPTPQSRTYEMFDGKRITFVVPADRVAASLNLRIGDVVDETFPIGGSDSQRTLELVSGPVTLGDRELFTYKVAKRSDPTAVRTERR